MSYVLEIEIMGLPKMANSSGAKSTHWRYAHAEATKWKKLVWAACISKKPPAPLETYRLTLTRYSSIMPDYDGLVRGFKHAVDGLKLAGVILDDRLSNSGPWDCRWEKAPQGQGRVAIRVWSPAPGNEAETP